MAPRGDVVVRGVGQIAAAAGRGAMTDPRTALCLGTRRTAGAFVVAGERAGRGRIADLLVTFGTAICGGAVARTGCARNAMNRGRGAKARDEASWRRAGSGRQMAGPS